MKFDLLKLRDQIAATGNYNWVDCLPIYQIIYNTGFHHALGEIVLISCALQCYAYAGTCTAPYNVMFGRESTYNLNVKSASSLMQHSTDCHSDESYEVTSAILPAVFIYSQW